MYLIEILRILLANECLEGSGSRTRPPLTTLIVLYNDCCRLSSAAAYTPKYSNIGRIYEDRLIENSKHVSTHYRGLLIDPKLFQCFPVKYNENDSIWTIYLGPRPRTDSLIFRLVVSTFDPHDYLLRTLRLDRWACGTFSLHGYDERRWIFEAPHDESFGKKTKIGLEEWAWLTGLEKLTK